jgi:hypothetical protein
MFAGSKTTSDIVAEAGINEYASAAAATLFRPVIVSLSIWLSSFDRLFASHGRHDS